MVFHLKVLFFKAPTKVGAFFGLNLDIYY